MREARHRLDRMKARDLFGPYPCIGTARCEDIRALNSGILPSWTKTTDNQAIARTEEVNIGTAIYIGSGGKPQHTSGLLDLETDLLCLYCGVSCFI